MIRVKIIGGLGNQLFQYACGRSLALDNNCKLMLDVSGFENYKIHELGITKFPLCSDVTYNHDPAQTKRLDFKDGILGRFYKEYGLRFDINVLQKKRIKTINGFFQSEKYFQRYSDIIREELCIPKPEVNGLSNELTDNQTVAIHFRRGDYLEKTNFGICKLSYYFSAINYLRSKFEKIKFFAFTDDPDWFNEQSGFTGSVELVSNPNFSNIDELYLMSACDHFIIANSSYSWWAAWLSKNPNKIVIAPKPWFDSDTLNSSSIVPDGWIEIPKS